MPSGLVKPPEQTAPDESETAQFGCGCHGAWLPARSGELMALLGAPGSPATAVPEALFAFLAAAI